MVLYQRCPRALLNGKGIDAEQDDDNYERIISPTGMQLIEDYHGMKDTQRKRLLAYVEALKLLENLEDIQA